MSRQLAPGWERCLVRGSPPKSCDKKRGEGRGSSLFLCRKYRVGVLGHRSYTDKLNLNNFPKKAVVKS